MVNVLKFTSVAVGVTVTLMISWSNNWFQHVIILATIAGCSVAGTFSALSAFCVRLVLGDAAAAPLRRLAKRAFIAAGVIAILPVAFLLLVIL
jgi:hypothetical protein